MDQRLPNYRLDKKKARKNGNFFVSMQKITTFACLFGEKPSKREK